MGPRGMSSSRRNPKEDTTCCREQFSGPVTIMRATCPWQGSGSWQVIRSGRIFIFIPAMRHLSSIEVPVLLYLLVRQSVHSFNSRISAELTVILILRWEGCGVWETSFVAYQAGKFVHNASAQLDNYRG